MHANHMPYTPSSDSHLGRCRVHASRPRETGHLEKALLGNEQSPKPSVPARPINAPYFHPQIQLTSATGGLIPKNT